MSFHRSIISSGSTPTPAASVHFDTVRKVAVPVVPTPPEPKDGQMPIHAVESSPLGVVAAFGERKWGA